MATNLNNSLQLTWILKFNEWKSIPAQDYRITIMMVEDFWLGWLKYSVIWIFNIECTVPIISSQQSHTMHLTILGFACPLVKGGQLWQQLNHWPIMIQEQYRTVANWFFIPVNASGHIHLKLSPDFTHVEPEWHGLYVQASVKWRDKVHQDKNKYTYMYVPNLRL